MQSTFSDVLETIEDFSIDEKETLIDILQRRLQEAKRERIVNSVNEARQEFESGELKPASADEIMNEVLS